MHFITLQTDEFRVENTGEDFGDFSLADARLAFQKQRFVQFERQ
jgi:hypothetical protein